MVEKFARCQICDVEFTELEVSSREMLSKLQDQDATRGVKRRRGGSGELHPIDGRVSDG